MRYERATKAFNQIKEARVIASSPPAISGLGSSANHGKQAPLNYAAWQRHGTSAGSWRGARLQ